MRRIAKLKKQRLCALTTAIVASAWMSTAMAEPAAEALPELKKVVSGVAENAITKDEVKHEMNIELGDKAQAVINWNSFNIGRDATVNFNGSGFKVLNRVEGNDPSEIYGNLKGTGGTVFLINPNGITFGAGAHVEVGSLVASTLNISDDNFNKGTYNFEGGNTGVIKNLADITANDGFVALLAHQVVNGKDIVVENGEINIEKSLGKKSEANTITAGQVAMAAGKNITLELQYDEKIGVRLNTSADNNGLTVITGDTGNDYPTNDYVINASNVTANRGYVLMKVSDVNEIGTNLVCQTGTVKASRMMQDEGGNIILQGDIVNAGGTLTATGKGAKIGIYGNSIVTADASAADEGGVIDIDTKKESFGIVLAGANLLAEKEVNTRANHSVIALDDYQGKTTTVKAERKDGTAGIWNITASKVKIDDVSSGSLTDLTTDTYAPAAIKASLDELVGKTYTISNNVIGNTLGTTNVNIKTDQADGHYVFSQEELNKIKELDPDTHYGTGDNNIEINADIKKTGGKETNLTVTGFEKKTIKVNGETFNLNNGNIELNAGISADEALNVTFTVAADGNIIVKSDNATDGKRTIQTGVQKPGTVTINGNITNDATDNHDSLEIKSGNTTINGNTTLNNLEIYSKGKIDVNGSVDVDNNMIARATDAPDDDTQYLNAKPADGEQDVNVQRITAGNIVNLAADNDVILNGDITAKAANSAKAVEIVAQRNFNNKGNGNISVGEGSNWKIYSATPANDNFGGLNSSNFAVWSWGRAGFKYNANDDDKNRYIFKETPKLTITANSGFKRYGQEIADLGYTWSYDLKGQFLNAFSDGDESQLKTVYGLGDFGTDSLGYPMDAEIGRYDVNLTKAEKAYDDLKAMGYDVILQPGTLAVTDGVRPQLENLTISNLQGSASYKQAPRQAGPGADRVLGLQSAELPVFCEEKGQIKFYGTYDVSIDPDKVKMEPTAKVLPEPDQPKNQYREYDKELTTKAGTAKFKMTYNGSTFDIYPVDSSAKKLLTAGDAAKNVEVESQALFAAFKEMGITLDALDGVYTHFDSKKEVQSFRR